MVDIDKMQIRWLIRRDMDDVLAIEQHTPTCRWNEEVFLKNLRQRNSIGTVAECGGTVVGFMVYELHKTQLRILRLGVRPAERRQGVGSALLRRLIDKLSQQRRSRIDVSVLDDNLPCQLLLQRNGFLAEAVEDDRYLMVYRLPAQPAGQWAPCNRIAAYDH